LSKTSSRLDAEGCFYDCQFDILASESTNA
jgi:hypothetical protein